MRRAALLLGLAFFVAGALAACGLARRGEPITGPMRISSPEVAHGEQVFMAHCQQCHPTGETGLGPAINNKPLPGFLIKFQVRNGLGAMPAFPKRQIGDAELDDLVAYLKALRRQG